MNAVLAQRKYRLAGRLATDTAMTFGLWSVVTFVVLLLASLGYREISGQYAQYADWVLVAIPAVMTVTGWIHLQKSYPLALSNGLTRKEFLAAYALFGAATILVAAALTQIGIVVVDQLAAFRGAEHHMGFYGMAPLESVARPALYFALGTAAGAAMLRFGKRWLVAFAAALTVAAVVYRLAGVAFVRVAIQRATEADTDSLASISLERLLVPVDTALAIVFALLAWVLLAKAPMRPKPA
jgi:hypothetical protein